MIKIYCDLDFFESEQIHKKENIFLLKLFKLEIELYVGIPSETLLSLPKNEESFFSRFIKSNNRFTPKPFDFENDEFNIERLKNAGINIVFTKFNCKNSQNIENKRGILIINNLDECVLHFKGGYITNITSKNNFNWDKAIFKGNTYPKWTSVLISDNYLFKDLNGGSKLGFYNLKKFFTNFLPKKSSEKIHITIVSSNSIYQNRGWTFVQSKSEWDNEFEIFKQSIKEINPDLEINIELFLTRKTIHKRVLITDFTYGWCDKGFKIYDLNNRINEDNENDFHYYNLFHNIQDYGDIFYNLAIENLRDIKKIIQEKIFISKDNDDFELFFGEVDRLNKCSKNPLILYEKVQN